MVTEDQSEVLRFLSLPSTHGGAPVECIETHGSYVFLVAGRAWKLKRAVRYDYLDFSTAARRKAMCEAELTINRRTAPGLYVRVAAVTREQDGSLAIGGAGTPVDWLLEMVRFDQQGLFDRLAASGTLELSLMPALGSEIARFHAGADPRREHGGRAGMAWVIDGNAQAFAEEGAGILDSGACEELTRESRAMLDRHGLWLDRRRDAGLVRQCHGDLHLRNIVLLDGRPTVFDGIEFNDRISCTDVLYDLAFLLMDLWRRKLPRHANAAWNGYLSESANLDGIGLMPLFLSCRAAVRAKTSATAARLQADPARRQELCDAARDYLTMARALLQPSPACLVAVGGLSGSGKSTLARALAPQAGAVPGAVVIRSDEIRKRLLGVDPLERLGQSGYTGDVTRRVYDALAERASVVTRQGRSAIVDAVYARAEDRDAIAQAAAAVGVRFVGVWLDAPADVLTARVDERRHDASDATADVVREQQTQGTGTVRWHRIDASRSPAAVEAEAMKILA
jgi:uncharacterized protein